MSRIVSAEEAVSVIKSGARVFVHSVAAAPLRLIEAMTARAAELRVVEIVSLHTEGPAPYAAPELAKSFRVNALFVGQNVRRAVEEGRADYLPVFLSEVPSLFRSGILPLDLGQLVVGRLVDGLVHLHHEVDRVEVDEAVAVRPRHPRVHLGDHGARGLDRRPRDVHGDPERAEAVAIRRGDVLVRRVVVVVALAAAAKLLLDLRSG